MPSFQIFIFSIIFHQLNKIICLKEIETLTKQNPPIDRRPPNLYKWIEENAHICTIVPINGKNLISFLSEEEGKKCALCPELNIHEIPTMACAIEITPNNIIENLDINCHKLPELCVLELKNRYAEFYMNNSIEKQETLFSKPSGENNAQQLEEFKRSEEEKIFQATELIFSTQPQNGFKSNKNNNKIEKEEEKEEKQNLEFDGTKSQEKELSKVFESLSNKRKLEILTNKPTTTTTINPENLNTSTTIRANIFAQMDGREGVPVNIKMTTMSTGRRILSEGEKEKIFPPSQQNNFDENEIIEKIEKRIKNIKKEEENEDFDEENNKNDFCKDTNDLCCFWAVAGECNNNPFWMRVKCPMTCGTCGCKVNHADKCKSTGVKCILPSTSTSTETTITTTTTKSTTKGPTPPPLTTTTNSTTIKRRKTRPTPPPKMPGHRPQRPKQWKSSTTTETTKRPKIVSQQTEYPPNPIFVSKNNFNKNNNNIGGDGDNSDNINLNNDYYADETEEPQIDENNDFNFKNHFSTNTISFTTQIYEENLINKNKLNLEEKKKISINKNWLNKLKITPIEPLTLPTTETSKSITTTTTITTTTNRQTCFNYHKLCEFWSDMGECESNPFWMRPHCQQSCSSCGENLSDISTQKPRRGCSNMNILCPFWAFIGECERNPRWMGMHCRASCQLC